MSPDRKVSRYCQLLKSGARNRSEQTGVTAHTSAARPTGGRLAPRACAAPPLTLRSRSSTQRMAAARLIGISMQAIINRISSKRWGKRSTWTMVLVIVSTRSPIVDCEP